MLALQANLTLEMAEDAFPFEILNVIGMDVGVEAIERALEGFFGG